MKQKKILITSGGTAIKIDDVRSIGNFSSGRFLSQIAKEYLLLGHEIDYLYAKRAKLPFDEDFIFDPDKSVEQQFNQIRETQKQYSDVKDNLKLHCFVTFDDYYSMLKKLVEENQYDIVILGAAVSDFTTDKTTGKISSDAENLTLTFKRTPKIINMVKSWSKKPFFQVGFKLLVRVPDEELIEVGYKSLLTNRSDLVVANDLTKIYQGKREVILVTPERGTEKLSGEGIAKELVTYIDKRSDCTHFKTNISVDKDLDSRFSVEFDQMEKHTAKLCQEKFFTPFFDGSNFHHGSLALRVPGGFLINTRSSNKANPVNEEISFIQNVDWDKHEVKATSTTGNKPSFNATLCAAIFERFPEINAVAHSHQIIANCPTTDFAHTPGTLEYAKAPLELLEKTNLINLKNHGLVAIGKNIEEAIDHATHAKTSNKQ